MRSSLAALAFLLCVSAVAQAAKDRLAPTTVRADSAIRQATKVAVRRARAIGLPETLVRRIEATGPALAVRARDAHHGNLRTRDGAQLTRTPNEVVLRGTVGSYFATIEDHLVRFGGTEWDGAIGSVRAGMQDRIKVSPGVVEMTTGSSSWIAHKRQHAITLGAGHVPAGSWLVWSTARGHSGRVAMTPDGRSLELTDADWQAAFAR